LEWSSAQSAAYLTYLRMSGADMIQVADAIDVLLQELKNEGLSGIVVTPEAFRAYQESIKSGFSPIEIEAGHLAGFNDESLEMIRQERLQREPINAPSDVLKRLTDLSASLRAAGIAIESTPGFGTTPISTRATGLKAAATEDNVDNSLVRL